MSSKKISKVKVFSGADRGILVENHRKGPIRIWWNSWASTIVKNKKVRYNHLHDLTYFSCKGGERNPRCRCGEPVPEELIQMSILQRLGVSDAV